MSQTRRQFLGTTVAAGAITVMPFRAIAEAHSSNTFETDAGPVTIHPVEHASFVMETPMGTIYVDPVGAAEDYADFPAADYILVTHEHGDHYNADVLSVLAGEDTPIVVNPAVYDMMPEALVAKAVPVANGQTTPLGDIELRAIPAYNTTEERLNFHPEGRDNGYVLDIGDFRVYISGDTEDIPEMRALEDVDLAFVCMNLPFTMAAEAAADAVAEFQPDVVYPYHYRGRDNGSQDPQEFADMVGDAAEVRLGAWYS